MSGDAGELSAVHRMKVSVITAVLNGAESIGRTLDSVAEQDCSGVEHVIADGQSTDGTLGIVETHGGGARLISGPDGGVYAAFNKGLRAATGDVIAFLNAGDVYESPRVISKALREMSAFGVDSVFGDVLIVDSAERSRVIRRYSSKRFTPRTMSYGFMPAHPTLFLRRRVYDELGGYDPQFRIAGDFEFCLRAFVCRPTSYRYVPEPLVRMPSGGLSNRGWRSKLAITGEMLRACKLNGVSTNWAKLSLRFPIKMVELVG
jgi:glycosyltransferase involved in cell wall biosynthesis